MKYALTHCYSDFNKGDAAIILSIIELIKKKDKNAQISLISTYAYNDSRLAVEHYLTKPYARNLYCSFFPEPLILNDERSKNLLNLKKFYTFLKYLFKYFILIIFSNNTKILKMIYTKEEIESITCLKYSDYIISKGGSFLYSFKGLKGNFFFFRMLAPIILGLKLKKKVILFSQSIGPLENFFSRKLFKFIAPKIYKIYLREDLCMCLFDELKISKQNVKVIPDTAFYLSINGVQNINLKKFKYEGLKVGITARPHDFRSKNQSDLYKKYINSFISAINFLTTQYQAFIYLFPQVIGPTDIQDDRKALDEIYDSLALDVKKHVFYLKDDYSPRELKKMYSFMDIFIATRLHSAIFATACGVPTINISYHGTKSQGIMNMLCLGDYVVPINEITKEILIDKIKSLITNQYSIRQSLLHKVSNLQKELEEAISEVIER